MNYGLSKSAEIVLSKSIFYVKNRRNLKKNAFKNINLRGHLKKKKQRFSLTSIFEPLYFLKSCPIFVEFLKNSFHRSMLILGQISYF